MEFNVKKVAEFYGGELGKWIEKNYFKVCDGMVVEDYCYYGLQDLRRFLNRLQDFEYSLGEVGRYAVEDFNLTYNADCSFEYFDGMLSKYDKLMKKYPYQKSAGLKKSLQKMEHLLENFADCLGRTIEHHFCLEIDYLAEVIRGRQESFYNAEELKGLLSEENDEVVA